MKNFLLWLGVAFTCIGLKSQQAVAVSNVNIREGASAVSKKIGVVPKGRIVSILDSVDGFCHIDYGGNSGYANCRYFNIRNGEALGNDDGEIKVSKERTVGRPLVDGGST